VAGQTSGSPPGTDSISTYSFRTDDLSKFEVRLRKLIALISELTNKGVFLSTAWSSELSDDHSEGSVMRRQFVLPDLGEGYRQGLHSMYCPQQPLTDFAMCYCRSCDDRHATRQCSPRNISFLQKRNDFENRVQFFTWRWKTLTQVCQRWRHVVLGSPQRLDLQLVCTNTTPTIRLLDIWPPFPIIVSITPLFQEVDENGVENLTAALKCRDRISEIRLFHIRGPVLKKLVTTVPYPQVGTHPQVGTPPKNIKTSYFILHI